MGHAVSKCNPPKSCFECRLPDCIYNGQASGLEAEYNKIGFIKNTELPKNGNEGDKYADNMSLQRM